MKNNIKPGTICTLTKNHSIIFELSRIDDNGWPYARRLVHCGTPTWWDIDDDYEGCVTYCDLFEEATPEQQQLFYKLISNPVKHEIEVEPEDKRKYRKMYFKNEDDLHEKMQKYGIKNEDIKSFVYSPFNGDAAWVLTDRNYL